MATLSGPIVRVLAISTMFFASTSALAQPCQGQGWVEKALQGRSDHAMAYDSVRGVTVLFGGIDAETWEWNGSSWSFRSITGPSWRGAHAMAFDSARGVTVLFGGYTTGGPT